MRKKSKIIVIFGCLCFFFTTCSRVHHVPQKNVSKWEGKKILRLRKVTGEVIEFSKDGRGRIDKDAIVGLGSEVINIEEKQAAKRIYHNKLFEKIVTKDGKEYQVAEHSKSGNYYHALEGEYQLVRVPVSEVKEIVVSSTTAFHLVIPLGGVIFLVLRAWFSQH